MNNEYKLNRIIIVTNVLCSHFNISSKDLKKILRKKENKYLYLLLLKKYNCLDKEKINKIIDLGSERSIKYNINKAEEKLLINKQFRDTYFMLEEGLERVYKRM
ncbi:hypothetical protein [Caproiciproducens sp. MSJ-32]|uniref:hypothetical protein n=1 Tax=Caproiciproducens sp. MSJ-32 TaxID=2841527 RepID=UPI001C110624|nr:hypothetical protein [Caproiciproducens sp. MSJ-32]MBU5456030.1 hypothetical protein [Caproiciproducens sp. MSJ-32]